MGQIPDLRNARRRLGLALEPLCHDRWVLGHLRDGWLQPIAASEITRRLLDRRPLMPLARRALYEKRPMVVNAVVEPANPSSGYDWELDWPAVLYGPVSALGQRPIGLLILGCRRDHWYSEADVAYVHSLGVALAPMVAALGRPLGRLNDSEGEVAQLLSYGMSVDEIARSIHADELHTHRLIAGVKRKLQPVDAADLDFPLVPMRRRAFRL